MQIILGYDRLLIIILCLFITHGRNFSKGSKKGCLKSFITFWRIEYLNSGSDKEPQISKIKKGRPLLIGQPLLRISMLILMLVKTFSEFYLHVYNERVGNRNNDQR